MPIEKIARRTSETAEYFHGKYGLYETAHQRNRRDGAKVVGVVGRDGGYMAKVADACVVIPIVNDASITPHSEAFHAVVWHLLVSHPALKGNQTKWESSVTATTTR